MFAPVSHGQLFQEMVDILEDDLSSATASGDVSAKLDLIIKQQQDAFKKQEEFQRQVLQLMQMQLPPPKPEAKPEPSRRERSGEAFGFVAMYTQKLAEKKMFCCQASLAENTVHELLVGASHDIFLYIDSAGTSIARHPLSGNVKPEPAPTAPSTVRAQYIALYFIFYNKVLHIVPVPHIRAYEKMPPHGH